MSYSIQYANAEQTQEIINAINSQNSEALYHLAGILKEQGDDENAEALLKEARNIDREDLQKAKEEREAEYREMEAYPSEGYTN